jgi:hypothetical protein|tara:strand:+ start:97 stop:429 length:333 start_codon:yes stop_codon:yes gene_type:complete
MSNKKYKSISRVLKSQGKSSEEFETMINKLSIEELIGLKLELTTRFTNGKFFGYPLLKSFHHVVRESLLLFAHSICKTNNEASSLLGITTYQYKQLLRKYKIREFFKKSD